jgi:hypothetical protein
MRKLKLLRVSSSVEKNSTLQAPKWNETIHDPAHFEGEHTKSWWVDISYFLD